MTLSTRQIASLLADAIHEVSQPANAPVHDAPAPARARPASANLGAGTGPKSGDSLAGRPGPRRVAPPAPAGSIRHKMSQQMGPNRDDYRHAVLHSLVIGGQQRMGGLLGGGIEFDD